MSEDEKPVLCPGCREPQPEGTYQPGAKWWWCNRCLLSKIRDQGYGGNQPREAD